MHMTDYNVQQPEATCDEMGLSDRLLSEWMNKEGGFCRVWVDCGRQTMSLSCNVLFPWHYIRADDVHISHFAIGFLFTKLNYYPHICLCQLRANLYSNSFSLFRTICVVVLCYTRWLSATEWQDASNKNTCIPFQRPSPQGNWWAASYFSWLITARSTALLPNGSFGLSRDRSLATTSCYNECSWWRFYE